MRDRYFISKDLTAIVEARCKLDEVGCWLVYYMYHRVIAVFLLAEIEYRRSSYKPVVIA